MANPFEIAVPTYYENWPVELRRLSMATAFRKMSVSEALALRESVIEHGEGGAPPEHTDALISWMDEKIGEFPKGAFVRLGSRSPKDSWLGNREGFRVESGQKAWDILTDCSERVYDDLCWALANDYTPCLLVREWLDMPRIMEFRCFVKAKKLVGISQYFYNDDPDTIPTFQSSLEWALGVFFDKSFLPHVHLDDVVVDVFAKFEVRENEVSVDVRLIEINPFSTWTDPCLFDWNEDSFDEMEFRIAEVKKSEVADG
jgi:hypothetical protein